MNFNQGNFADCSEDQPFANPNDSFTDVVPGEVGRETIALIKSSFPSLRKKVEEIPLIEPDAKRTKFSNKKSSQIAEIPEHYSSPSFPELSNNVVSGEKNLKERARNFFQIDAEKENLTKSEFKRTIPGLFQNEDQGYAPLTKKNLMYMSRSYSPFRKGNKPLKNVTNRNKSRQPTPKPSPLKVTKPESPKFTYFNKKPLPMSTLERELKELQERPKFHAKPFNKKLLINKPIIQHPKASPKLLSFEEFSLSKPLEKQPEPELTFPQFKANKLNKNVLNQPWIPEKKDKKITEPEEFTFETEKRGHIRKPELTNFQEARENRFKAKPVPKYTTFQPKPREKPEPTHFKEFKLTTETRGRSKDANFQDKYINKVPKPCPQFKARPAPPTTHNPIQPSQPPKDSSFRTTIPKEFSFQTSDRAQQKKQEEELKSKLNRRSKSSDAFCVKGPARGPTKPMPFKLTLEKRNQDRNQYYQDLQQSKDRINNLSQQNSQKHRKSYVLLSATKDQSLASITECAEMNNSVVISPFPLRNPNSPVPDSRKESYATAQSQIENADTEQRFFTPISESQRNQDPVIMEERNRNAWMREEQKESECNRHTQSFFNYPPPDANNSHHQNLTPSYVNTQTPFEQTRQRKLSL